MYLMAFIVAATNKLLLSFQDKAGRRATMGVYVEGDEIDPEAGAALAIGAAAQGMSEAALKRVELLLYATEDTTVTPGTDAFDRPTDKLMLRFVSPSGAKTSMAVPSVLAAYYGLDGTTPLTTAGPAQALIDAIQLNCVSADGELLSAKTYGQRFVPKGLKSWNKK